jgi:SAM-dependent methyltransferase
VAFLEVGPVPVHVGVLWPTQAEALACPSGEMTPGLCARCGHVYNVDFDPERVDYSRTYDNALHFSSVFQAYENELARRLFEQHDLAGKTVVEIGCGSGHFLGGLMELGAARGFGYDPSHDSTRVDPLARGRVEFVRGHYPETPVDGGADLVVLRHVLEHVDEPARMLASLHEGLGAKPGAALYCEVPNGLLALREHSIWDLMYEHCSYFVPESLRWGMEAAGFEVLHLEAAYGGQFLGCSARVPAAPPAITAPDPAALDLLASDAGAYREHFEHKRDDLRRRLAELAAAGRRVVVWGAGGKTVGLAAVTGADSGIELAVDVNPGKQGTFLAGSGWRISAPEELQAVRPDVVLLPNPIYRDEVAADLSRLGVSAELWTV